MRTTRPLLSALLALLMLASPAQALLGPSQMKTQTPRAGDIGLYAADAFRLDGENASFVQENGSIAFKIGAPESIADAYGRTGSAHEIQFQVLRNDSVPLGPSQPIGQYVAWRDERTQGPLVQGTSYAVGMSSNAGFGSGFDFDFLWKEKANRATHLVGPSCALVNEIQGQTLHEDESTNATVCGEPNRALEERIQQQVQERVVDIQALEEGRELAHIQIQQDGPDADLTVNLWYRSDIPYPIEIAFNGSIPGASSDQDFAALSPITAHVLAQAFLPEWIGHENLTRDQDNDGRVSLEGKLHLARFERGQGPPIPADNREPWPSSHVAAEMGPIDAWGPAQGGETFDYTLDEAAASVQSDPSLTDFQDWLDEHPEHQLVAAWHDTYVQDGRETQRWRLIVSAPDHSGWSIISARETGAQAGDQRIGAEVPVSENSADQRNDLPYIQDPLNQAPTIRSAIEIWAVEMPENQQPGDATDFSWTLSEGTASMSAGRSDLDSSPLPGISDPSFGWDSNSSRVQLNAADGSVAFLFAGGFSADYASIGTPGTSTDWRLSDPTGNIDALSAPVVTTLAATSSIVLLALLAAKLGVLPFYSRLRQDELLDNDARKALYASLEEDPGLSLTGAAEATGLARSTARYHLRRLEEGDLIRSVKGPDARRFFLAGSQTTAEMQRQAVLQSGRTRDVYEAIQQDPGTNLSGVCKATGLAASSAHRIVERLVESGLVQKEREGRSIVLRPAA